MNYEIITQTGIQLSGLSNINEILSVHYLIYRIDNIRNNEFYIGQHKTNNIYDTYMGSGVILKCSLQHYQLSNFVKTYLYDFDNEQEMDAKELELMPEISCHSFNPLCLNIVEGGGSRRMPGKSNPMYGKNIKDYMTPQKYLEHNKKISIANSGENNGMFGKTLSCLMSAEDYNNMITKRQDTIKNRTLEKKKELHEKFSKIRTGSQNPAFSRKWMYNKKLNCYKYVKSAEIQQYLDDGYIFQGKTKGKPSIKPNTKKWINNGKLRKLIDISLINEYLDNGWKEGKIFQ